ncbi:hypothetical protein OPQ81_002348 [Rhizoctonia solani]|nr:hypothetical protein OPQ81_002348 [Rhizoctonia solani]
MVWACIGWNGLGYMIKIDENVNKELYIEILEDELPQTSEYYDLGMEDIIFQQDNAKPHTAKIVQEWFKEHDLEVVEWLANSLDLSPIENAWNQVKRRPYQYKRPVGGILELWGRIQEVWNEVTEKECQDLFGSMTRRVQACIEEKGGPTKY